MLLTAGSLLIIYILSVFKFNKQLLRVSVLKYRTKITSLYFTDRNYGMYKAEWKSGLECK